MRPECTADCDMRVELRETDELLVAAVAAIIDHGCPFAEGGILDDREWKSQGGTAVLAGLHVDGSDPECYANVALKEFDLEECLDGGADEACCACILRWTRWCALQRC